MKFPKESFGALGALLVPVLGAGLMAFVPAAPHALTSETTEVSSNDGVAASLDAAAGHIWKIRATDARIIGGYGDNFAYDGENVRPVTGWAEMTVDAANGRAELTIELETTEASGPIRYSRDEGWSGKIRIVQKFDTSNMDKARIVEEIALHGDTGNEAPVMPNIYSYFATWGPAQIWVNGEEVVPMVGSHTMFSERARSSSGKVVNASGDVYSPMSTVKNGFTDPEKTEFHFVAHTTQPDPDNFPPHTAWIHLNFSSVELQEQPDDVEIPYTKE